MFKVIALFLLASFWMTASFGHDTFSSQLEKLNHLIEHDPTNADLLYRRGVLHFQEGKPSNALIDIDQVLKIELFHPGATHVKGELLLAAERFNEAKRLLVGYCEKYPADAIAQGLLGHVYARLHEWEPALLAYAASLSEEPQLQIDRAAGLLRDFEMAPRDFTVRVIGLLDNAHVPVRSTPQLLLARSRFLEKRQDFEAAISDLRSLMSKFPQSPYYSAHLGDLYQKKGELENAISNYRTTITLIDGMPERRKALPAFQAVRLHAEEALTKLLNQYQGR